MSGENRKVPKRISQTVLNSLKGGVVPRIGLPYITVGRKNEIEALLHDVDIISEGGASFRFIVGRYGSGKSFLIQTIRNYVMDRGFIVADADLSPERRLQGTRGQGLATYRELIGNLSTKTKPEGGALTLILDRWISAVQSEAMQTAISDHMLDYITRLCAASREDPALSLGISPRGALSVSRMARACASVRGRDYVIVEDVQQVFLPTCAHRVLLSPKARMEGNSAQAVLQAIVRQVKLPHGI